MLELEKKEKIKMGFGIKNLEINIFEFISYFNFELQLDITSYFFSSIQLGVGSLASMKQPNQILTYSLYSSYLSFYFWCANVIFQPLEFMILLKSSLKNLYTYNKLTVEGLNLDIHRCILLKSFSLSYIWFPYA